MFVKAVVILCVQALFAQVVFSQCGRCGGEYTWGLIAPSAGVSSCGQTVGAGLGLGIGGGAGYSAGAIEVAPTSGGGLPVYSVSSIAPNGISVTSENSYEGSFDVIGSLPFLSAVSLEGVLPTAGAGAVNYGCGNGVTAITSELSNGVGVGGIVSGGIGSGVLGYGSGLGGCGVSGLNLGHVAGHRCGCGLY